MKYLLFIYIVMADTNNGGNAPKEWEGENLERDWKKDDSSLKPKFLKEFAEEKKLWENKENYWEFLNKLFSNNVSFENFKADLYKFSKGRWISYATDEEKNERKKFDCKTNMNLNDLRNQFRSDYMTLKQNSDKLEELFSKEFNLLPEEKIKLKKIFNTISQNDFYIYARSFTERKKLLEKNGIRDTVEFKNMPKMFLKLVEESDFKKRQDNFSEADKIIFNKFFKKIESWEVSFDKLEEGDIYDFFMKILRPTERIEFLKEFFPYISFWDLKWLEILGDEKILKIKKGILREYFSQVEGKWTISDNELNEFLRWKSWNFFDDILISTEQIFTNENFSEEKFQELLSDWKGIRDSQENKEKFFKLIKKSEMSIIDDYNNFINYTSSWLKWDFYKKLAELKNVTWAENFKDKWVIVFTYPSSDKEKRERWEKEVRYLEIGKIDEKNEWWGAYMIDRWLNKYNPKKDIIPWFFSFPQLYDFLKDWNKEQWISDIEVKILSWDSFQEDLNAWKIEIDTSLENFKDEIDVAQNVGKYKDEIERLKEEEWKTEEDSEIKDLREKITQERKSLHGNIEALKDKLDEVDEAGKNFGLEEGTTFTLDGGKGIFTIKKIAYDHITVSSPFWEECPKLIEFFQVFEKRWWKRVSKAKKAEDVIQEMSEQKDIWDSWKEIKFENNKFILKGKDKNKKDKDYECNIFISPGKDSSDDGRDFIKIHSINGDRVSVSFWERKVEKKEKKNKKTEEVEKITENTIDSISPTKYELSMGQLTALLKQKEMKPDSYEMNEEKRKQKDEVEEVKGMKGSWTSRYMQGFSFDNIIKGATLWWKGYTERLEKWSEEKAAMFANNTLGKIWFLPSELRTTFQSKVESEQKKRMEEYISQLDTLDSKDATLLIKERLLNKDVPQYKLEAGLVFLMQKYWVLYAKKHLQEYQGTFLWYKALGGEVWDDLYNEVKAELEGRGECFVEEHLVYVLLVKQCWPNGYNGIKRRSKLHKHFKRIRAEWKEKEMKDWYKDWWDERTMTGRLKGFYSELKNGNTPNALGWAEKVMEKWSPWMKDISEPAFIIAFSWVAYDMDNVVLRDHCKKFLEKGHIVPMWKFLTLKKDIDLLNDSILAVSKRIEQLEPKYNWIANRAQKIFDNLHKRTWDKAGINARVSETQSFYKDYGEVIIRAMYNLNDGRTDKDSRFNKMLEVESKAGYHLDWQYHKEGNKKFAEYYKKMNHLCEDEIEYNKEHLRNDTLKHRWISWTNAKESAFQSLWAISWGGWKNKVVWTLHWEELRNELIATMRRDYGPISEEAKKSIRKDNIKHILKPIIYASIISNPWVPDVIRMAFEDYMPELSKWGIDYKKDIQGKFSYDDFDKDESPEVKDYLERLADSFYENIPKWRSWEKKWASDSSSLDTIIIWPTKDSVDKATWKK